MPRQLPPLPALRTFEVAARHLSFVGAGGELNVTPGAVSHQIKQLEAWIGEPLFNRRANGVSMTATGRVLAARLSFIFDQIAATAAAARQPIRSRPVTVRCQYSLASKWLVPRIATFQTTYPDISVSIRADSQRMSASEQESDLVIYCHSNIKSGVRRDTLIRGKLVVVASPETAALLPSTPTPLDLLSKRLISVNFSEPELCDEGWEDWFFATGVGQIEIHSALEVNFVHLAIEACLDGSGFALVPNFLIERELNCGRLVKIFEIPFPIRQPYLILTPDASLGCPEVSVLRNWLIDEARKVD